MPQIPWVAVLVATATAFALGAVWYGPRQDLDARTGLVA